MQLLTVKELLDIGQAYLAGVQAAQAGKPYNNPYSSQQESNTLLLELRYADLDPVRADYCYQQNLRTAYEQGYKRSKLAIV